LERGGRERGARRKKLRTSNAQVKKTKRRVDEGIDYNYRGSKVRGHSRYHGGVIPAQNMCLAKMDLSGVEKG